jgi:cell division protein FtsW (lipid II flippase)
MAQPAEWSAARIALALVALALLLKTEPWSVIPRLTTRGVSAKALPRVRLIRRRAIWLGIAFLAAFTVGVFPRDAIVKWSLFAISVAALVEVLKVTIELRRLPPRGAQDGA